MKLYEVPRNTKVRILNQEITNPIISFPIKQNQILDFYHIDGMYSHCSDEYGDIVHPAAWTEVEIVE